MLKKKMIPVVLSSLLLTSPIILAVDEHHPEEAAENTQGVPSVEKAPADAKVISSGTMMMRPGMMSGQQSGDSQGGMMAPGMMGQGGMMSKGMKGGQGKGMMGHGMMHKHQQVINRLDLLDARMAKIETMLERLLQR
ncbi:MAG: hypothetical protein AAES65_16200 [Candidatus Thiodiazotropha sp. (ex. Lucinoma kazani)]